MRVEYESEDDAPPVNVLIRFFRPSADVLIGSPHRIGRVPPPASWTTVLVRGDEYSIKSMTFSNYPDEPHLDWVEVLLS